MAKKYTGSLTLEWFNKNRSIITQKAEEKRDSDVPAPRINWINKDEALFYEISEDEGKGLTPYWVDRNDIRVKESRPLVFQKAYKAVPAGEGFKVEESDVDDPEIENILIKGDNLLALNTLKKMFDQKPDEEKVKCIYIDPPYNTGQAFENYEDNGLVQSEWLTLMRDRIYLLHKLLSKYGVFFIQLDEKNIFHIRVMLDEIFGKSNFINFFTVKTSDPSGLKTVNPSPYDSAEYILMYAKNKSYYKYDPIYVESDHDYGYSKYIENIAEPYEKWIITPVAEYLAKTLGYKNANEARKNIGKLDFNDKIASFAIENCHSVFQGTAISNDAGRDIVELRDRSKLFPDKVQRLERNDGDEVFALNGRQVYFYSNKVKNISDKNVPTMLLTNIWNDIPYNGISKEGDVIFKESKKPEKLIERLLCVANLNIGDIVLDSFAGSGTTLAVANKKGFSWIGIELGNHAETHIKKRMIDVIKGMDQSGVSNQLKWKGGGSFKYYHLGESIIATEKDGYGDFNWSLDRDFIERSLLATYDFVIDDTFDCPPSTIENPPKVGFYNVNNYTMAGIVSLSSPEENYGVLDNEYVSELIATIRKLKSPQSITIFTNRGVELAWESKPEDVEIIKVPHAIFAELER